MDWKIWGRKAVVGTLVAAGLGALGIIGVEVSEAGKELSKDERLAVYVAALMPLIQTWIGMAQNYLKHAGPPSVAP